MKYWNSTQLIQFTSGISIERDYSEMLISPEIRVLSRVLWVRAEHNNQCEFENLLKTAVTIEED